uniref:TF-B3 domain-containing protein n=1 Tax=Cucumis sativus TaxID=3659 RepID=A0A0A0KG38_CUCSA
MAKSVMAVVDPGSRIPSTLEFFKVFLPNSSSQSMSIPPAFVKYFNGRIPSEAIIRDQSRNSWHVTLEELKNIVLFKDGWQEFVDSHHLKRGYFLVFQYDGSHVFDVKIFGKNGCKKELVSRISNPVPTVKVKDEPLSEEDYSTSLTRCKRSDSEVRSTDSSGTAPKSRRRSTSNLEEHSPSKTAKHISMKLPSPTPTFKHIVKHWSYKAIQIPQLIMVSNDILLKPNLVIIDEMGRSWVVKARPISRGRFSLTSGWGAFFIANSLTIDDECTFEFVLDSNNLCGELKCCSNKKS